MSSFPSDRSDGRAPNYDALQRELARLAAEVGALSRRLDAVYVSDARDRDRLVQWSGEVRTLQNTATEILRQAKLAETRVEQLRRRIEVLEPREERQRRDQREFKETATDTFQNHDGRITEAKETADSKYTKPATGIPDGDLEEDYRKTAVAIGLSDLDGAVTDEIDSKASQAAFTAVRDDLYGLGKLPTDPPDEGSVKKRLVDAEAKVDESFVGIEVVAGEVRFTRHDGTPTAFTPIKGEDGTSITVVGSAPTEQDLPDPYSGDIGDGYVVPNSEGIGELWIWDGTTWNNAGPFQGPPGESITADFSGDVLQIRRVSDNALLAQRNVKGTPGDSITAAFEADELVVRRVSDNAELDRRNVKGATGRGIAAVSVVGDDLKVDYDDATTATQEDAFEPFARTANLGALATKDTVLRGDLAPAVTDELDGKAEIAALGTAAFAASTAFATAAQGTKADTATQPGDLASVATSGAYDDLNDKPTLGSLAAKNAVEREDLVPVVRDELDGKADIASLAPVATSGAYSDLSDRPPLGTASTLDASDLRLAADPVPVGDVGGLGALATKSEVERSDLAPAVTDELDGKANSSALGSAAFEAVAAFATAAQGTKADTATQPGDLSPVATSGAYDDLSGKPVLGTAAAAAATDFATAAQGTKADSAIQAGDLNTFALSGQSIPASAVPDLPASRITSGTFGTERLAGGAVTNDKVATGAGIALSKIAGRSVGLILDANLAATFNRLEPQIDAAVKLDAEGRLAQPLRVASDPIWFGDGDDKIDDEGITFLVDGTQNLFKGIRWTDGTTVAFFYAVISSGSPQIETNANLFTQGNIQAAEIQGAVLRGVHQAADGTNGATANVDLSSGDRLVFQNGLLVSVQKTP